jgi:hypothetical protein
VRELEAVDHRHVGLVVVVEVEDELGEVGDGERGLGLAEVRHGDADGVHELRGAAALEIMRLRVDVGFNCNYRTRITAG